MSLEEATKIVLKNKKYPADPKKIKKQIKKIQKTPEYVRSSQEKRALAMSLAAFGQDAVKTLQKILDQPPFNSQPAKGAVWALGEIAETQNNRVISKLAKYLNKDIDLEMRVEIIKSLRKIGGKKVVPPLKKEAERKKATRASALIALGKLNGVSEVSADYLNDKLSKETPVVRLFSYRVIFLEKMKEIMKIIYKM